MSPELQEKAKDQFRKMALALGHVDGSIGQELVASNLLSSLGQSISQPNRLKPEDLNGFLQKKQRR